MEEKKKVETIPVISEVTGMGVGTIDIFIDERTKKKYAVLRKFLP